MIKIPLEELTVGKELAVDVKIQSRHPNSLYRLRIDEGTTVEEKHVERLEKAGVPFVFIKDGRTDDLDKHIVDRDLQQAEDEILEDVKEFGVKIRSGDSSSASPGDVEQSLENLIDVLRNTDAMKVFTTLKAHHDYTVKHSLEVAKLVLHMVLSRQKKIHDILLDETGATASYTSKYMVKDIGMGALLHDLGKWNIPTDVLDKREELNLQEWNAIQKHPKFGVDLVKNIFEDNVRSTVMTPILQHHEKYGGDGYPDGKVGEGIHLYGRITGICDVFSALTSRRPYRVALTPNRAFQTMHDMQREDAHFDPDLFTMFQELVPPFPLGQQVVLSNGNMGVVSDLGDDWNQPTVRVLKESNNELDDPYEITANTDDTPSIIN